MACLETDYLVQVKCVLWLQIFKWFDISVDVIVKVCVMEKEKHQVLPVGSSLSDNLPAPDDVGLL